MDLKREQIPSTFKPLPDCLAGRNLLLTGVDSGIGRALALNCAKYGAQLILWGQKQSHLEQLDDEIRHTYPNAPTPTLQVLDFNQINNVDSQIIQNALLSKFTQLDGVLHNAAYLGCLSPLEFTDDENWYKAIQVNLHAAFLITKLCLPLLKRAPLAQLLFTMDDLINQPKAFWGGYAVSKFGLYSLAQTLAIELKSSNVRVNLVNPGVFSSNLRSLAYPAEDPSKLKSIATILPTYLYLLGQHGASFHQCWFDC